MRRERLLQFLSVAIIFTGGIVTHAQARESGAGCTGVYWAPLPAGKTCADYPDDNSKKTYCDDYFKPPNDCPRPGSVNCGEDNGNGWLMRCDYGY